MKATIHIYAPPDMAKEATELQEELAGFGVVATSDSALADTALLIALSPLNDSDLQTCFENGIVVIPAASFPYEQLVGIALAFVAATVEDPDDVLPEGIGANASQAGQKGMERIDSLLESLAEAHILEQLAVFLSTTQHISVPLIQAGQMETCLLVCKHAAHSLLELLQIAEVEEEAAEVVQAIAEAVASTVFEIEDGDIEVSKAVETLLDCFGQLSLGLQTASALMLVEETFDDLHASGRGASAPLLHDVIQLTLAQCEALNESMAFTWCGHVYLLAAKHLNQFLGAPRTNEDAILPFAREQLAPFQELDEESLEYDAEAIVLALHEVLIDILEYAEDERPWAHDS